jgi:hypothetical protein
MTPEVILALLGILGTLLGTLAGSALSNHYTAKREERQWDRQIKEQRRGELFRAYEDFLEKAMPSIEGTPSDQAALWHALARVELLAPDPLAEQARNFHTVIEDFRQLHGHGESSKEERDKAADRYLEAADRYLEENEKFIAAVRRELRS